MPHDILKINHWTRHTDPSLLPEFLRDTHIAKAVEEHHSKRWVSDKLASAVARPFFDSLDYVKGDLDSGTLFFIPIYGPNGRDIVIWDGSSRASLQKEVWRIFEDAYRIGDKGFVKACRKVNERLVYFPADTWSPISSLKAHHIVTAILHEQDESLLKGIVESSIKKDGFVDLLMLTIGLNDIIFHKLRELREFYKQRNETIRRLRFLLPGNLRRLYGVTLPLVLIGDELITITVDRSIKGVPILKAIINTLSDIGVVCVLRVTRIRVRREKSVKRKDLYYIVDQVSDEGVYSIGSSLEEGVDRGSAEFANYMDYPIVVWIDLEVDGDLPSVCRRFVEDYAIKIMERIAADYKLGEVIPFKARFVASPDVMMTVVDDYNRFLRDLQSKTRCKPVIQGFYRSLFLAGVKSLGKAFSIHEVIIRLKKRLHIPVISTSIVTYPKNPFWRVVELMFKFPNTMILYPRGGVTLSLKEDDFNLMMKIKDVVKGIKPSVWEEEVVPSAARSLAELQFELECLSTGKGKITSKQASEILEFARRLDENHKDEPEEVRRKIRLAAFKRLAAFAKGG